MANGATGGSEFGGAFVALLQLIFSLTFPLLMITVCGASFLLTAVFHAPEFSLWARLGLAALAYAKTNNWAAIGLVIFALAALPLAWVAFREQQIRASSTILAGLIAIIAFGGMFWLRTAWPYDQSVWQAVVYAVIMLSGWSAVIETGLGVLGIVLHVRASRPVPARPPAHQPHGARDGRGRPDDSETI